MWQQSLLLFYLICVRETLSFGDPCQTCLCKDKLVDCSKRGLESVPMNIPASTETLLLNNNQITAIEDNVFANLTNLTSLFCGFNQLTNLTEKSFTGLKNLKSLYLQNNKLTDFPPICATTPSLYLLVLTENSLSKKPFPASYSQCQSLGSVGLTYNYYPSLTPSLFNALASVKTLKSLKLNNMQINQIDNSTFNQLALTSLDLSNNNITFQNLVTVFSEKPVQLLTLTLKDAGFSTITKSLWSQIQFTQINIFSLTGNRNLETIEAESFDNMLSLTQLFLNKCPIKSIDGIIDNMRRLQNLDVSSTQLASWHLNTVSNLPNLMKFYASENLITTIGGLDGTENPLPFLKSPRFIDLNVNNNPFNCTCRLKWFVNALKDPTVKKKVRNVDLLLCATPQELAGSKVITFDPGNCSHELSTLAPITTTSNVKTTAHLTTQPTTNEKTTAHLTTQPTTNAETTTHLTTQPTTNAETTTHLTTQPTTNAETTTHLTTQPTTNAETTTHLTTQPTTNAETTTHLTTQPTTNAETPTHLTTQISTDKKTTTYSTTQSTTNKITITQSTTQSEIIGQTTTTPLQNTSTHANILLIKIQTAYNPTVNPTSQHLSMFKIVVIVSISFIMCIIIVGAMFFIVKRSLKCRRRVNILNANFYNGDDVAGSPIFRSANVQCCGFPMLSVPTPSAESLVQ